MYVLSGGVDSSAITATAAKHFEREGKAPLHTFRSIMKTMSNIYVKLISAKRRRPVD
ncbi:asparagine synthase-related protein [Bacillus licheniformis]|nr:asparagine synthase-related protein [Bacillus licheniformis]